MQNSTKIDETIFIFNLKVDKTPQKTGLKLVGVSEY